MRTGLVLGAGGGVGAAFHAGALAALEHDLGWDPRTADVIVGTSAGAFAGALLRRGVAASDLAAWGVEAPLSPEGAMLTASFERTQFDPVTLRQFLRPPRVPHPSAVVATLRRLHRFDPLRALMTHLADGPHDLQPHASFLGAQWPERDLLVCAVRRRDGRRAVFGRGEPPVSGLAAAVAASCAVPGYFRPVPVDGELHLDGGVRSPTNADVLQPAGLDVVVVVAPMCAWQPGSPLSVAGAIRRRSAWLLDRELAPARAHDTEVLVVAPGRDTLASVTPDFMSGDRGREIVAAAFLEAGEQLRAAHHAGACDRLDRRHVAA